MTDPGLQPLLLGDTQEESFREHIAVMETLVTQNLCLIKRAASMLYEAFICGKKILLCGNGGSAADAQHIAAEFIGRFERNRKPLAAIAITTNSSVVTALGNDYGFRNLFARQIEGLAQPGDIVIGLSTSGRSRNMIVAMKAARRAGCRTIGLTGAGGSELATVCDLAILVPSKRTARIQEAHITIGHVWCETVENLMHGKKSIGKDVRRHLRRT